MPTVATYFLTLASHPSYLVDEPLGLITLRLFDLITPMRTRRGLRRSASLPPVVAVAVDETSYALFGLSTTASTLRSNIETTL
jgi:hypothetical protein